MTRRTTHGGTGIARSSTGTVLTVLTLVLAFPTLAIATHAQRGPGEVKPTSKPTASAPTRRAAPRRAAESYHTTGWMLGAHSLAAPGLSITGEDIRDGFRTNFGGGGGIMVGYAIDPRFAVYGSLDLAKQGSGIEDLSGSFGLAHAEVGGRVTIPTASARTFPYATAGIGHRALGARIRSYATDDESEIALSGTFVALGGGLQHYLSPRLALDGGAEMAFGKFGHLEQDGDESSLTVNGSHSVRVRFGVTWHP